jgi:hypothetical protein
MEPGDKLNEIERRMKRVEELLAKLQSLIGAVTEIPVAATLRDMLAGA